MTFNLSDVTYENVQMKRLSRVELDLCKFQSLIKFRAWTSLNQKWNWKLIWMNYSWMKVRRWSFLNCASYVSAALNIKLMNSIVENLSQQQHMRRFLARKRETHINDLDLCIANVRDLLFEFILLHTMRETKYLEFIRLGLLWQLLAEQEDSIYLSPCRNLSIQRVLHRHRLNLILLSSLEKNYKTLSKFSNLCTCIGFIFCTIEF